MIRLLLCIATAVVALSHDVIARMRVVPEEYATISSAVEASQSGDTVLVHPGEYAESAVLGCRDYVIVGQFIFSGDSSDIDATIWRAEIGHRHLLVPPCQDVRRLLISGLTFQGGSSPGMEPKGGIELHNREFRLENCVFDSCFASTGGSINADSSIVTIRNCEFLNSAGSFSGRFASFNECMTTLRNVEVRKSKSSVAQVSLIALTKGSVAIEGCQFNQNLQHTDMEFFEVSDDLDSILISSTTFRQNSFNSFFSFNSAQSLGILVSGCTFDSNSVSHDMFSGFTIPVGSNVSVSTTTFQDNWVPQGFRSEAIVELRAGSDFTIKENLFHSNNWTDFVAIAGTQISAASRIERNYFIQNRSREVSFVPTVVQISANPENSFWHNIFIANLCAGAVSNFSDLPRGHAEHNYWGHASGPYNSWSNPEGLGDTVDTLIFYEPWEEDTLFLSSTYENDVPISFALGYPYPNPFNSSVTIEYALTREQNVQLEIYDVLGRQVETILNEQQGIGVHSVLWKADEFASGLYFARLSSEEGALQAVKLMLLK